jgi:predicted dehydrogenase
LVFWRSNKCVWQVSNINKKRPLPNSSDLNDVTSEDVCLANIEISNYSSNLIPCQVSLSSISKNGRGFSLEIYGSEGSLILKSENQKDYVHGFNLKYSNNENKIQNLTADLSFNFEKTWTDGRIAPVLRIQNLWAQSIINGTPVIPGLCEGLASHKVCEAIRESSKSGLSIKI